ncbi:MAG TPA: NAD(P)H-dependent glycerol-3-phosphate dehydrogenase [Candidatus Binatia bacterium]|nr:NAD(P)H-dependent glycerol-3-phosphate dehydrogenase [Candidatus Binatia bacterium]
MTTIAVLGAGSYGTALAIQLARRGNATWLWGRDAAMMERLAADRVNADYLPGCRFPDALTPAADLAAAVRAADDVLLAVPSHAMHALLRVLAPMLKPGQGIACASKGLEPETGKLPHEIAAGVAGASRRFAMISGPTFAREVGQGMPTAVTVASSDAAFAEKIMHALHGNGFRAYSSDDVVGVEIGGAAKNVVAIGVGIGDGLGLGANTRAALITRGLAEIMRLGEPLGARRETFMGLAGLGDLVLTCTDDQSRNRRLGLALAKGRKLDAALAEIRQTVEGVRAAPEVLRLARRHRVDMPITEQVVEVLAGRASPIQAVQSLATRPPRAEND